jgi:predicted metal-dependent phosphoesterase TrpH
MNPISIDLHLHTTASDGRCTPDDLVQRAHAAGLRIISVTDHDTAAAVPAVEASARSFGMEVIRGIEITSVHSGKDVHVLAYNLPQHIPDLEKLMSDQRQLRIERAQEIARRLAQLGASIDTDEMLRSATSNTGKAIARPQIAQLLIAAGHVASVAEAFDRFLGEDSPAYVPHRGVSPMEVVSMIVAAGGLASLAHPGYTKRDEIIPAMVEAGLGAIEAFHSSHDPATEDAYVEMTDRLGLAATGGSDYHGEGTRRAEFFGKVGLPENRLERLRAAMASGAAMPR